MGHSLRPRSSSRAIPSWRPGTWTRCSLSPTDDGWRKRASRSRCGPSGWVRPNSLIAVTSIACARPSGGVAFPPRTAMGIEEIFRADYGRILATLIRLLGDIDVAEEALQEAFAAALEQWPAAGIPANPVSWLVSTGRHKAIDRLRRRAWLEEKQNEIARHIELSTHQLDLQSADDEETPVPEDRLRLIFTCCHPALATEAQVALTLRTLGGLSTEEIARAFLVPAPTMAQRLVRAKAKIRAARIPYQVPPDSALAERLEAVMVVVYLVFNEGYAASFGARLVRNELCEQAIRLGRML